ncbi:MAG TPA: class I SAM-dependent methyltransferase, partial [Longimicrobium sp.]|nr:class I SAM-dependent methyltransferase [Longimicrobium sp.]
YDWLEQAAADGRRFDVAFSSYGAICWLTDLAAWARGVAGILAPGGRVVLMEFHPVASMYEPDMTLRYPYSTGGRPSEWEQGVGDYVAESGLGLALGEHHEGVKDFQNPHRAYDFQWGVGEIIQSLIDAGLAIETFREYLFSNGYQPFRNMREEPGRRFRTPEGTPDLPLMYAVAARKAG